MMMQMNWLIDDDEENEAVGEMTVATKTVLITLNFTLNVSQSIVSL